MRNYLTVLTFALTAACAGAQNAPGTAPGDMSNSEHQAEADKHEAVAEGHEDMADSAQKPAVEDMHEREAGEHSDVADQHQDAAK